MTQLRRVPQRLALLALVLLCWGTAELTQVDGVQSSPVYLYGTGLLLAIGLFASTAGIDRAQAREHRALILAAVTIGVVLKAAIIGGVLLLATHDPVFLVFGIAVAQIDPLSVAALLRGERMSSRAKTILAAWASFDDPVTVILVVYAVAIVGHPGGSAVATGLASYGVDLALNLGLAVLAWLAWRLLRRWPVLLAAVLTVLLAVAVWQFLMLGVALAGLFIRPVWIDRWLSRATTIALFASGALLGLLLVGGVAYGYGVALGVLAFVAQIIAGILLTRGLPAADRAQLALAQQNGITAIILALRLEVDFPGAVAVIAPAIVVTNATHLVANWLLDRRRV